MNVRLPLTSFVALFLSFAVQASLIEWIPGQSGDDDSLKLKHPEHLQATWVGPEEVKLEWRVSKGATGSATHSNGHPHDGTRIEVLGTSGVLGGVFSSNDWIDVARIGPEKHSKVIHGFEPEAEPRTIRFRVSFFKRIDDKKAKVAASEVEILCPGQARKLDPVFPKSAMSGENLTLTWAALDSSGNTAISHRGKLEVWITEKKTTLKKAKLEFGSEPLGSVSLKWRPSKKGNYGIHWKGDLESGEMELSVF